MAGTSLIEDAGVAERMIVDGWSPLGGVVTPEMQAERTRAEAIRFARSMAARWEAISNGKPLPKVPEVSDAAVGVALRAHRRCSDRDDDIRVFDARWQSAVELLETSTPGQVAP